MIHSAILGPFVLCALLNFSLFFQDPLDRFLAPLEKWNQGKFTYYSKVTADNETIECFGSKEFALVRIEGEDKETPLSIYFSNNDYSATVTKQATSTAWKLTGLQLYDKEKTLLSGRGRDTFYQIVLFRLAHFQSEREYLEREETSIRNEWVYRRRNDAKPFDSYPENSVFLPLKSLKLVYDEHGDETFPIMFEFVAINSQGKESTVRYRLGPPVETAIGLIPSSAELLFEDGGSYKTVFSEIEILEGTFAKKSECFADYYGLPEPSTRSDWYSLGSKGVSLLLLILGVGAVGIGAFFKFKT